MYPPIFEVCAADSDVQTNIGISPCRLYPFGEGPERVTLPYAVWQVVGGAPENCMDSPTDMDSFVVQVDAYSDSATSARDVASALRKAIEPYALITSFGGEGRDPDTNYYRYMFSVDWLVDRDNVS